MKLFALIVLVNFLAVSYCFKFGVSSRLSLSKLSKLSSNWDDESLGENMMSTPPNDHNGGEGMVVVPTACI